MAFSRDKDGRSKKLLSSFNLLILCRLRTYYGHLHTSLIGHPIKLLAKGWKKGFQFKAGEGIPQDHPRSDRLEPVRPPIQQASVFGSICFSLTKKVTDIITLADKIKAKTKFSNEYTRSNREAGQSAQFTVKATCSVNVMDKR
jgi:hypothetical protein